MNKLALGTVQFGLPYGVANTGGQVSEGVIKNILLHASNAGIDTLDTAMGYGDSEQCLGHVGVDYWKVITKLPEVPEYCSDVTAWVNNQFDLSIARLGLSRISGLMLHRPKQLLSPLGEELWAAMQSLKDKGLVVKIGYSIYEPVELDELWVDFRPDIVQAPFNLLDQRLKMSGWLKKLHSNNVELHVRSVFLQGLLLMNARTRPAKFKQWDALWGRWSAWLSEANISPLQACLNCVLSESEIDRVVIGIDTLEQLKEILQMTSGNNLDFPDDLCSDDVNLINPARWDSL